MDKPLVSVIMGIYNCADTLGEAIECICNQTYDNWELIMCDDGSMDSTYETAKVYYEKHPDKIILIRNEENSGLNVTLNNCLKRAKGKYIARMDGDDLCSPVRFEKEVDFLEKHPEYDIVSTNMTYFDDNGIFGQSKSIEKPECRDIVKGTPFCHTPCMVRKSAYDEVGGYSVDNKLLRAEDYHLWVKMYSKGFKGYNIQEPLYSMRDDRNAAKRRKMKYRINEAYVKCEAVKKLKLPYSNYVYAFIPILKGIIPSKLYLLFHKHRLEN